MLLHPAPLPCRECKFFFNGALCKKGVECSVAMDRWCFRDIYILSDACSFFQQNRENLVTESELFRILRKGSDTQLELF